MIWLLRVFMTSRELRQAIRRCGADISLANANAIVRELKGYIDNLELIASEISNGNGERLQEIMEIAKESRGPLPGAVDQISDSIQPPFLN